ncbi:diacylglycerol kinase [Vibrio splendidus]|uniref:Diacylglycerol kinase n=1 Tax=Vibrio splendidus TaxID=29497 RepID=A0A2T5EV72_VIBSP|nr:MULTISPECIES: diacylglycerol kinase [Vibrio]MBO7913646.1 diacylglycerol kinase [Vibrio sp. G41H]MCF7492581.1 diacylglycerol kinase [Vibrio sp. G-C-1]MDH5905176.1 diacylglycerol kinase [Vibrio splendidus]OEF23372.1 diacylglycerol kinase [Vibrio splendidus 1S-124]OEF74541.1 diacylglycerol kinase [Vibrio splendidus 1F-157]
MSEYHSKPGNSGIKRIIKATGYSIKGVKSAFQSEAAIRQELALCLIFIPIAFCLDISKLETLALVGTLVFIFILELINSAIEAVVDRIGPEHHELSGKAKDIGSAAVMVAILFAIFTWLLVLV